MGWGMKGDTKGVAADAREALGTTGEKGDRRELIPAVGDGDGESIGRACVRACVLQRDRIGRALSWF